MNVRDLQVVPDPYTGPDRRRWPRQKVRLPVRFTLRGLPIPYVGTLEDVSLGGVRMATSVRLKVGEEIGLYIPVGPDEPPMIFRAAVVRTVEQYVSRLLGVAFLELEAKQMERLERLLNYSARVFAE